MEQQKEWIRGEHIWDASFLHTYPLTMFGGVILSFLSIAYFWKRQKYSWEILQLLLIIVIPCAIAGARLWFLISEGGWSHWWMFSGLSIQGGVAGGAGSGFAFLYTRRHAIDIRTVFGIVIPCIFAGQALGRWGNFANHEVYGLTTSGDSLDWMGALKSHMYIKNTVLESAEYRQPLFFYEFLSSSIGFIVLRKNWVRPGVTVALYLIWYGITRSIMEPLRFDGDIMRIGSLPISLMLAILMVVVGVALAIRWQFFDSREYDLISPIKERKLFLFGPKSSKKKKYLFFGEEVDNKVRIWLPANNEWTKKEINKGKRK